MALTGDIEGLISGAVAEATGGDEGGGDEGSSTESVDTSADLSTESGDSSAGDGDASAVEGAPEEIAASTDDSATGEVADLETPEQISARETVEKENAELLALGFKPAAQGRDNRIPHSRVRQMLLKGLARKTEAHTKEIEPLRNAKDSMDRFDHLIGNNPDALMAFLQQSNPAFKEWNKGPISQPVPKANEPEATFTEKMPAPDKVDDAGNPMYSPEQFEKFIDWQSRKAEFNVEKRLKGEMEKRFTPFEKEAKAREAYAQRAERIRSTIAEVKATWGDLLPAEGSKEAGELMALMTKNPGMTFAQAASAYIVPKLRTDRTKMRADIIAEINKAPRKASKGPGGAGTRATSSGETAGGERKSTEDVIRQSMRDAGLTQN